MRVGTTLVLVLCGVLATSPVLAATVQPISGILSISENGGGYLPVAGPTDVPPGTLVMVSPGGAASITYPDGCAVQLQSGEVIPVQNFSPCVNPYAQQVPPPTQNPDYNPWLLAGGGLVLAAVGVGVYFAVSASP